jgi:hypothetical protein
MRETAQLPFTRRGRAAGGPDPVPRAGYNSDGSVRVTNEDHIVGVSQVIVPGDLAQLVAVLGPVPAVRFIRNEPDRPPRNVSEEELRGRVEGDFGNPQLERVAALLAHLAAGSLALEAGASPAP